MIYRSVYLAARYSRNAEMRGYRDRLTSVGIAVTSRWIDLHGGAELESATTERLNTESGECWQFGLHDLEDIRSADALIAFSGSGGRGGRHVEYGYALALEMPIFLIGERENVFYCCPSVVVLPSFEDLLRHVGEA